MDGDSTTAHGDGDQKRLRLLAKLMRTTKQLKALAAAAASAVEDDDAEPQQESARGMMETV